MGGNYLCGFVIHQDLGLGKSKLVENENATNISLEILPRLDADYILSLTPMIRNGAFKGNDGKPDLEGHAGRQERAGL